MRCGLKTKLNKQTSKVTNSPYCYPRRAQRDRTAKWPLESRKERCGERSLKESVLLSGESESARSKTEGEKKHFPIYFPLSPPRASQGSRWCLCLICLPNKDREEESPEKHVPPAHRSFLLPSLLPGLPRSAIWIFRNCFLRLTAGSWRLPYFSAVLAFPVGRTYCRCLQNWAPKQLQIAHQWPPSFLLKE